MSEWLKKRTDTKALRFVEQTACVKEFGALSNIIHRDDVSDALMFLGFIHYGSIGPSIVDELFEPTELPCPLPSN